MHDLDTDQTKTAVSRTVLTSKLGIPYITMYTIWNIQPYAATSFICQIHVQIVGTMLILPGK